MIKFNNSLSMVNRYLKLYPKHIQPSSQDTINRVILFFCAQIHRACWTSWLSSTIVYSRSGDNPNYPKHIQLSSQDNIYKVILFFSWKNTSRMLNKLIKFKNSLSRVNRYLKLYPKHIQPSSKYNIHRVVIFFSCTNTVRMLNKLIKFKNSLSRVYRYPKLSITYSSLISE